ncbi:threonine ammonia-lyase [Halocatena halophila]|uniref:threonine ammonia-lyase n=1 Tax=Halocatena halophila TaxID=2814576 RepID=UPI002ED391AD
MPEVTLADVQAARDRCSDESVVRTTPLERSRSLSSFSGGDVWLKMEHLQRTGSFKTRGAYNKLVQIADEFDRVVAASAGNHAQGVALAATKVGVESTIVMPENAPQAKIDATRGYGATVVLEGHDFQAALEHAQSLAADDDIAFIHAYDDPAIVAGQGTLGVEIHEKGPDIDTVVVPIGGGGLIGGVATALKTLDPSIRVVGVQAKAAATVPESLDKGFPVGIDDPRTIADGIATGGISTLTFELIEEYVDEVVLVSDEQIANATLLLLERAKQLVEGAAAASVGALLSDELDVTDETVVAVLGGGNIDISMLQTVLTHALSDREQLIRFRVRIDDQPGTMGELSSVIGDLGANIRSVRHDRAVEDLHVGEAYLVFEVTTSGAGHARNIIDAIESRGYTVDRLI